MHRYRNDDDQPVNQLGEESSPTTGHGSSPDGADDESPYKSPQDSDVPPNTEVPPKNTDARVLNKYPSPRLGQK